MPLLSETYALFDSADLDVTIDGFEDLIHYTDESDNPQQGTIWFGSLGSGGADTDDRVAQAQSDPGVDQITLTVAYILGQWTAATNYSIGDCVEPITPNGYRYRVTTDGGSSHATTEPTWPTTIGATVVDQDLVWTCVSAKHEVTEVTLALTEGDLDINTPGAALDIGASIESGTANGVEIWWRIENNVNTVSNNTSTPELALQLNAFVELENL
jgi:hypothetical protein